MASFTAGMDWPMSSPQMMIEVLAKLKEAK
jgi:hypothetical protein